MIIALEQEVVQQPLRANQIAKPVVARKHAKSSARVESPYTAKNLDSAITHLEYAVAIDGNIAVFGRSYWLDRARQIATTSQILPAQSRRLQSLLDRLMEG